MTFLLSDPTVYPCGVFVVFLVRVSVRLFVCSGRGVVCLFDHLLVWVLLVGLIIRLVGSVLFVCLFVCLLLVDLTAS